MYTTHHACWDAKNRYNLPEEMPFAYEGISHIIGGTVAAPKRTSDPEVSNSEGYHPQQPQTSIPITEPVKAENTSDPVQTKEEDHNFMWVSNPDNIPKALKDLMRKDKVTEWDIQNAVAKRGYFTSDIPIERFNESRPGFVEGALVAGWPKVMEVIKEIWEKQEIPFN